MLLDGGAHGGEAFDDGIMCLGVVAGVRPPSEHALVRAQRVVDLVQGDVVLGRVQDYGGIDVNQLKPKSSERRRELGCGPN